METVLKRLRRRSPDAVRARQLYREAFPPNERAPFFLLARRAEKGLATGGACAKETSGAAFSMS